MRRLLALLLLLPVLAGCARAGERLSNDALDGSGPITLVVGRDTTDFLQPLLQRWNRAHPGERVTLIELPEAADEQRAQMVANLQARSDRYDVLALDVIWTAEFADRGWIEPLDRRLFELEEFLSPAVETATYRGRLWAVPFTTNVGLLYYRTDLLAEEDFKPPTTWEELRTQAIRLSKGHDIEGYAAQLLNYEGLTVNFTEAVQSAGGQILSADGTAVTLDPESATAGMRFLADGLREGWISGDSLSYKEEGTRRAFAEGRVAFARNWPYAYGPTTRSKVGGKFAVTRLPGRDGPGSSSLGGYNLAVNTASRRQKTAVEFIRYAVGDEAQRLLLTEGSYSPVRAGLYDDSALVGRFPYLPVLKESILAARPRPVSPDYNQVSLVIANSVTQAVTPPHRKPDEAVAELRTDLSEILRTR